MRTLLQCIMHYLKQFSGVVALVLTSCVIETCLLREVSFATVAWAVALVDVVCISVACFVAFIHICRCC